MTLQLREKPRGADSDDDETQQKYLSKIAAVEKCLEEWWEEECARAPRPAPRSAPRRLRAPRCRVARGVSDSGTAAGTTL